MISWAQDCTYGGVLDVIIFLSKVLLELTPYELFMNTLGGGKEVRKINY